MATSTRKKIKPARAHATSAKKAQGGSSFFGSYLTQSRAPLTILVFLLPLLISYEILLALALRSADGVVVTNEAHRWILSLFGAFELGAVGLWLPGVLVVAILLIWHSVERRPWKVEGAVVGLMWSESIVLALPLLVFSQAALRIPPAAGQPSPGQNLVGQAVQFELRGFLTTSIVVFFGFGQLKLQVRGPLSIGPHGSVIDHGPR